MDTKVTLEKTSCYFCAEWLDDKSIKDHLLTCGQVLEKCPFNCLSYIQRKNMDKHLTVCPKRSQFPLSGQKKEALSEIDSRRLSSIEENLTLMRKALNEEIQMRHDVIGELGNLKRRNQITDEWTVKVSEVLNLLQKRIEEEKQSRNFAVKDLSESVESLLKQLKEIKVHREEVTKALVKIETKISSTSNNNGETLISNSDSQYEVKRLEKELERLKIQSSDDMNDCVKYISAINDKLNQVEMLHQNQHNYTEYEQRKKGFSISYLSILSDSLMHSLSKLDRFETELTAITGLLNNLNDRHLKTDYNIKTVMNTVQETEDKTEKLEKEVAMYKELMYETKQGLADLEEHLKVQRQFNIITNIRGHLIWKISHYSKKLNDSKEFDVPLKSPLFSNKHYGYALRLDVHLNGIGTWKNRNLIACLTVVNGDFDTLLPWPCKLKADIILRDQPDDIAEATDITKLVITKKRNDKLEYQNQFIHIPHQLINSGSYIRNDAIILEVKIQKTFESSTLKSTRPVSITPTQI